MTAMQRANEIVPEIASDVPWAELVSRGVNDLSRIIHAEIRLAELGIKDLVEREIARSVKLAIALGLFLCAAACMIGAALIGLHALLGVWWAAFALIAAISGSLSIGFFLSARGHPQPPSTTSR